MPLEHGLDPHRMDPALGQRCLAVVSFRGTGDGVAQGERAGAVGQGGVPSQGQRRNCNANKQQMDADGRRWAGGRHARPQPTLRAGREAPRCRGTHIPFACIGVHPPLICVKPSCSTARRTGRRERPLLPVHGGLPLRRGTPFRSGTAAGRIGTAGPAMLWPRASGSDSSGEALRADRSQRRRPALPVPAPGGTDRPVARR
jgi:hypothetical protein